MIKHQHVKKAQGIENTPNALRKAKADTTAPHAHSVKSQNTCLSFKSVASDINPSALVGIEPVVLNASINNPRCGIGDTY